ncbi:MAG TPA: MFS transporter, partial [Chroococcales cyanobacterium]
CMLGMHDEKKKKTQVKKNLLRTNFPFLRLWSGQLASQIGDRIFQLAIAWWILKTTSSPFDLGVFMVLSTLPAVVLGPLGGTFVDAFDRRKIMCAADLVRGTLVALLSFLYFNGSLNLLHVFLVAPLLAATTAFFEPGLPASLPHLVAEEDLNEAMSLQSLLSSFAGFIGPVFGGGLVAFLGVGGGLLVNAMSFFFSGALILSLSLPKGTGRTDAMEVLSQLVEGLDFARKQKVIFKLLLAFAGINLFLVPNLILLPMFVSGVLNGKPSSLGFLEGAIAVGMAVASLLISRLGESREKKKLILLSLSLVAMGILGMASMKNFYSSLFFQFLIGVGVAAINVNMGLVFQRVVPDEMKGRFFSLVGMVAFCSFPLAYLWVGFFAQAKGVPAAYLVCGIGLLVVTLFTNAIRGLSEIGEECPILEQA